MADVTTHIIDGKTLSYAMSQLSQAPVDGTKECVIRDWKERRRLIQNALYWVWLTYLEDQTGQEKEWLHDRFSQTYMLRIYQIEQVNENQVNWIELYTVVAQLGDKEMKEKALKTISTTWADVDQFRTYLNAIERFCQQKGYMLPIDPRYKTAMAV